MCETQKNITSILSKVLNSTKKLEERLKRSLSSIIVTSDKKINLSSLNIALTFSKQYVENENFRENINGQYNKKQLGKIADKISNTVSKCLSSLDKETLDHQKNQDILEQFNLSSTAQQISKEDMAQA